MEADRGRPPSRTWTQSLLDQVLIKFYWLRGQAGSAQETFHVGADRLDCGAAALGRSVGISSSAHIPFLGSLLKNEQDTAAMADFRATAKVAARCPSSLERPRAAVQSIGCSDLHQRWRRLATGGAMFLDLFYGLREEGVPGRASRNGMMFMTVLEQGPCTDSSVCSRSTTSRKLVRWSRARPTSTPSTGVFAERLPWRRGASSRCQRRADGVALRIRRTSTELSDEQRAACSRSARRRRAHAEASSRRLDEQDRAPRRRRASWIGTGGHSPFGHGGEHPDRHSRGWQIPDRIARR